MGRQPVALLAFGLLGCAQAPAVPPGSKAETQLHAPCPAQGGCAEPLVCVGGSDARQEASCELDCSGGCPPPTSCMARPDGESGGVCAPPPTSHSHPFGN